MAGGVFGGGNGTIEAPYLIEDVDDLNMVRRAQGMKGSGADLLRKWVTRGYCTFDAAKQQYTKSEEFIRKHAKAA